MFVAAPHESTGTAPNGCIASTRVTSGAKLTDDFKAIPTSYICFSTTHGRVQSWRSPTSDFFFQRFVWMSVEHVFSLALALLALLPSVLAFVPSSCGGEGAEGGSKEACSEDHEPGLDPDDPVVGLITPGASVKHLLWITFSFAEVNS